MLKRKTKHEFKVNFDSVNIYNLWMQNVLSFSKQLQYLMHYKIHLGNLIGKKKAEETIRNAIFVVSAGTNDFIANYYLELNRSTQFTVPQYENYLIKSMSNYIKVFL